jgi:hypothetical protein
MATIIEGRYASAINARNLVVDEKTTFSDSDVLGAMGLADRRLTTGWVPTGRDEGYSIKPAPLAVPLARLLAGDNKASHDIVAILAQLAFERSWVLKVKIGRATAHDMACACLAWHRNGRCDPCGGHGKTIIPGTKTLSDHDCPKCRGSGKVAFERNFRQEWQELARWLVVEIERASAIAGPQAMKAIAQRMEL